MAAVSTTTQRSSISQPASGPRVADAGLRSVGDYDLLRRLGSGAMGEVWLGKHRTTGGLSAVKVLHAEIALRERVQRFFARERRAIARLSHPHIVALHDLGPDHIATAYIDGADLARRMQTPIEPGVAVRYATQIASALAHAHAHGVVHRDVKPSNILVDRRGNAYLADFGLAAILDELDASQDGAGTPAFMAPEQARGLAGPAADQYGLARTLVDLLAGVSVGGSDPFAQLPPGLPRALVDALKRAMARDPAARFPTLGEFAGALATIDLGGAAAPMRVAAEQRVRAPFGWCVGASATRAITHEIRCADYRLSDLERAGLLSAEACAQFRERVPYAELGWTMFGHEGRLGPIASDGALARASDLVVILHGLLSCREDWRDVAVAICRNNAQAVVLVPDLYGCGESRYAPREYAEPRMASIGRMDGIVDWLDLLSVRDLPTVLVGHSFSGVALLSTTDERLGERMSRVAITPAIKKASTPQSQRFLSALRVLAGLSVVRPAIAAAMRRSPVWSRFTREMQDRFADEFFRAPAWVLRKLGELHDAMTLAPPEALRRCAVLVGEDDALAPAEHIERELESHGFPMEFVSRIAGSGHYPHAENTMKPEARARNIEDITRCVDRMLASSRDGSPLSTRVASTVLGT